MVKKGKPKPHVAGAKKEKLFTPSTIALIALIIMVGSVIILPNNGGNAAEEQAAEPQQTGWVEQILENAPPSKMPLNDTEVYSLLNSSRPVARFFYSPSDPSSKQAGSILDGLADNQSLVLDRINVLAQCTDTGAEYIRQYCPKQAPLTILYLPNGQAFTYPGPIDKGLLLKYMGGNFTPAIRYYPGNCEKCPKVLGAILESLNGTAKAAEISEQEARDAGATAYPVALLNRTDLMLQSYANGLNYLIAANPDKLRIAAANESIAITPNPHALFSEECAGTAIKFFFSPSSPTYANDSAMLKELQAKAGSITVTDECLPLTKEDADTCLQKYNQTTGPMEEARRYSITTAPAYVIDANCKYETIEQGSFTRYGENATAELRKQACAFGNC